LGIRRRIKKFRRKLRKSRKLSNNSRSMIGLSRISPRQENEIKRVKIMYRKINKIGKNY
jgi:hypothetical protein